MKKECKELYIDGMHCASCELIIEKELKELKGIKSVDASLKDGLLTIEGKDIDTQEIKDRLKEKGYTLRDSKPKKSLDVQELILGFIIALTVTLLFLLLEKSGHTHFVNASELTYPVIFLIGIAASLSSCMAVVGGLVLSISTTYSKDNSKILPLSMFHISRLVSFLLLGGVLGLIGSVFRLSPTFYFAMSIIVFIVMLILGLNLLDIPFFKKFQITLPKGISNTIFKTERVKNILAPILLGFLTFFLPCGFTQSMQISAIASGNLIDSALIMFVFALGTFPALALISFGSNRLSKATNSSLFFKVSGFLVIFFSIYTFISSLVSVGILRPIF